MPTSYIFKQTHMFLVNVFTIFSFGMIADCFVKSTSPAPSWIIHILASMFLVALAVWLSDKMLQKDYINGVRILTGQWLHKNNFVHLPRQSHYFPIPILVGLLYGYLEISPNLQDKVAMTPYGFLWFAIVGLLVWRWIHVLFQAAMLHDRPNEVEKGYFLSSGQRRVKFEDGWKIEVKAIGSAEITWQPDTPALRKQLLKTCKELLGRTRALYGR